MTPEDKQLIAGYMGWAQYKYPPYYLNIKGDIESHHFDLNDAGLCVQEIQKRDDWRNFLIVARKLHKLEFDSQAIAWLFIADNFFGAMAAWLKEEKK